MADSWFDDAATPAAPAREILSISQLNGTARMLLERGLGTVWLEGEISNLARPASGHWYFSLKDEAAQVRCAMFRSRSMLVRFPVKDGAKVLARGRVSLYEARGEFQVVVDHLEEAGEGALRRRFDELKKRLLAEGLFESSAKQPLPTLPRRIGVITSPTGAALRDILHILQRRFPAIPVLVYPVTRRTSPSLTSSPTSARPLRRAPPSAAYPTARNTCVHCAPSSATLGRRCGASSLRWRSPCANGSGR